MRVASGASARALADARPARVRWGDLPARVLSAVTLGPMALFCVWHGGTPFGVMMVLVAGLLISEWQVLTRGRLSMRAVWAGTLYLAVALVCFSLIRDSTEIGRMNLLFVIAVVWSADIGAYAVGRLFGGPKLAPAISPGKTWSGAAGGTFASVIAGVCVAGTEVGVAGPIALALLLSVAAQVGDLFESALKRRLGVKDSGALIPGHGGLLDRLDGMLLATPVAALLAVWTGRGVELWR